MMRQLRPAAAASNQMRIDGHQHFWTTQRDDYGWLTSDIEILYKDFDPKDLQPLLDQAGVDHTVLVQAAATTDETRYLLGIAEYHSMVAGVVGWVDMDSPNDAIEALDEFVLHPKFVGIRPMIQDIEDPAWIDRPELDIVLDALVKKNVCFDALVRSVHLPFLLNCLTRHPELRVVINHGAKPNIAVGEWQPWADGIAAIANQTSSYCKVSGLITEASSAQTYDDVMPYLDHLLEVFGPGRLIWGSDWPVLNLAGDYKAWNDVSTARLEALSTQDQDDIFGRNAIDFYNLKT
jgi:L-fuconolactonase